MEAVKRQLLKITVIFISLIALASCKRETPIEMLFGNWKVTHVIENNHNLTREYLKKNSPYLVLSESGYYQIGLLDSSSNKTWLGNSQTNELTLTNSSIYDNIKKWQIKASDDLLLLEYPNRAIQIKLERLENLPTPIIKSKADLVGKWGFNKVTINGINSTSNYPNKDRWIILAKNGRFYNGADGGNQNTGFWDVDDLYKKVEFRNTDKKKEASIIFHINKDELWYEKEKSNGKDHTVRIYFKKENS